MAVTLTKQAADHVRRYLAREAGLALRLGVKRTGCSGWAYVVDIAERIGAGDRVFEDQGLKVVVDEVSLPIVDGTEVDFVRSGLNRNFVFRNPNAGAECGCGESFSIASGAAVQ